MTKYSKKRKDRLGLIITITLIIIVLIMLLAFPKEEQILVEIGSPEIGEIAETISANGKIKPVIEVKISPDVSGEIVELYCQEGDTVSKGDLLIQIKQDVYLSAMQRAEASLNSTKAQFAGQEASYLLAEQEYHRNKQLYLDSIISLADYENSMTKYKIEKSRLDEVEFAVKSDEAFLQETNDELRKTIIYAPISGIISKMMVEKGERVVGTSQMEGTEMLRIANFEQIEVIAEINENDILKVHSGDSASLSIDAHIGKTFKGVVTNVANSSSAYFANQVTNFEIKIGIIAESYSNLLKVNEFPFRPGMSASATIFTDKKENIIVAPLQCVIYRDNSEAVWVVNDDNTVTLKKVTTGIQDLGRIEIISGLDIRDKIVIGPYSAISKELTEGDKIGKLIER